MKVLLLLKRLLRWICYLLAIPILYLSVALLLSAIPCGEKNNSDVNNHIIYLNTNGIHLDIIIPKQHLDVILTQQLYATENDSYLSFGWGDENFYINTPTWGDLTFKNACSALFLKITTLMHVTRYKNREATWVAVAVSATELKLLNQYILESFKLNTQGNIIILPHVSYTQTDNFYKAQGSYSCFKTCNTWVNKGFKTAGLKACLWTPFDFGLLNKYD